ncbi:MAG TPA: malic enzyme-like NAD(P)-binding protein [Solirubrobacteraceae bacterium]|nr:malic enzyme-like NAD(P)-binding protein [Solirubrobacteraceae bacterium]
MPVDFVYRIEQPHRTGMLARVCRAIADGDGLIGDVRTVSMGPERSIRDIDVEVRDVDQAHRLAEILSSLDEVDVLDHRDRAIGRHEGGKIAVTPRIAVNTLQDLRDIYTPGVARVCTAIQDDPRQALRYTWIGRTVAICTNGTRVLGLGDIGTLASMPVMEGKAIFYTAFTDLNAVPILIDQASPDGFVRAVIDIADSFGAIHLEDIRVPECFEIEARLVDALDVPVLHHDVHAAATTALAATLTACAQLSRPLEDQVVGQIGLGAAGFGIACLLQTAGAKLVLGSDPDATAQAHADAHGIEITDFESVLARANILIAATGVPGLIGSEQIREGQVVIALTNPEPEISPSVALRAGAAFAADGSVVNTALAFPGIFLGALSCGARTISTRMLIAAARAIARLTRQSHLVPDPLDRRVHREVARAVADAARQEGLARPDRVPAGLAVT